MQDVYDHRGRVLDGPDDDWACSHGVSINEPCRECLHEANTVARGVNPWPNLDDLEDLPY